MQSLHPCTTELSIQTYNLFGIGIADLSMSQIEATLNMLTISVSQIGDALSMSQIEAIATLKCQGQNRDSGEKRV